ncbi:MAG: hemolysin family protein [Pseudomonadota bacterium]|nr:hemolysin family protein [Pseudomonadota bacterium]
MSDPATGRPSRETPDGDEGSSGVSGWFSGLLRGLVGGRNGENGWRESLEELLEEHEIEDTPLSTEERRMLSNIMSLGEKRVDDVMVPRADIVGIAEGCSMEEIVRSYLGAPHSRLPVYRGTLDEIVGILHIKDLVRFWGQTGQVDILPILREPLVVPPSKAVIDLLVEMRASRRHLAIVIDEYGGVDGLVTIEDLIEEVVGDIRDEHDSEEDPSFVELPDGTIEVDARYELGEFEQRVGCDLLDDEDDEEIDTLGGFVFYTLGRVPKRGEVVRHASGYEFEVTDADPRRIKRLRVRHVPKLAGEGEDTAARS